MTNSWDDLMKMLVKGDPQSLVSFLLPGAQFQGERDRELKVRTVFADVLYDVIWKGMEIILHVEFQRNQDKEMGRRVWEYNVLTNCLTRRPVYSVVIYLVDDGEIVESPYQQETAGELVHVFYFHNIKLWKVPAAMLKQPGVEGLLPLLPLTEGGQRLNVVEEAITRLRATGHQDLLALSYAFAGLVFTTSADRLWLKERFEKMHEILKDSWSYQEMVEKGLQQGLQQGALLATQQAAINIIVARFTDLETLARTKITTIGNLERLQQLIVDLSISHSREEAERVLLSLDADA